ncbi:hypothetical protein FACS189483_07600 [Spirochaetia bacterium]|nr:hypothetical protein FACS189483_07600 [Spirochaetia bacterium]
MQAMTLTMIGLHLVSQNSLQRTVTPAVRLYKGNIALGGLAFCDPRHIMGDRGGKKDN